MSQDDQVLEWLKSGRAITPAQAHTLCGTLALHSIIARLRARGHVIDCEIQSNGKSRWGLYTRTPIAYG